MSRLLLFCCLLNVCIELVAVDSVRANPLGVGLTISVDWEGQNLRSENIEAMIEFRKRYPDVKLVHFLNAAYFFKPKAQSQAARTETAAKIRSVLRSGDELGLHIHGWKSLFQAAGVEFNPRVSHLLRYPELPAIEDGDIGHQAAIHEYSVEQLRKVIRHSVSTLGKYGFQNIESFRAGGWMAGPNVLEALVLEGFKADSSAVPRDLLDTELRVMRQTPLYRRVEELWPDTTPSSLPHMLETPSGTIAEYPNTSCLADYVSAEKVLAIFRAQQSTGRLTYLHFGFHQETAAYHLPRVIAVVEGMKSVAAKRGLPFVSRTLRDDALVYPGVQSLPHQGESCSVEFLENGPRDGGTTIALEL